MSKPKAWVKYEVTDKESGKFVVSPLDRGMGNTIGNSMRRVLLSSLSGAAITAVKIEGINHEFSSIPNVIEDALDIICNLKGVIFQFDGQHSLKASISAQGKGKVTAKNIQIDSSVKIFNKNHFIAECTDGANLEIEFYIENGNGYLPAQLTKAQELGVDFIAVDASFSPIVKVNPIVENIRVGKELDHDQLTLEVITDGSVAPDVAIQKAANILIEKVKLFKTMNEEPEVEKVEEITNEEKVKQNALDMSIDDLELSARSSNCLKRAGIETVGSLVEKDMSELIQIKNFGKKSADEINDKLKQFSLVLKT